MSEREAMGEAEALLDIPGTTVFTAAQSRKGYWLNQFCMSLMKAENREAFLADQPAYLARWKMSDEQRQAVLDRDWNRMIALGSNIYFLAKIFATDGKSFQWAAGEMTGMGKDDYTAMMLAGGRSPSRVQGRGRSRSSEFPGLGRRRNEPLASRPACWFDQQGPRHQLSGRSDCRSQPVARPDQYRISARNRFRSDRAGLAAGYTRSHGRDAPEPSRSTTCQRPT